MTSEIVEPDIERVKISLAEENIIEQIHNYLVKLASVAQEIENTLDDIFKQKFESARTRANKIFEDFKSIYLTRSNIVRYIAKISILIANGSHYVSLAESLTSLTHSLHKLILDLELLSTMQINLNETLSYMFQNVTKQVREFISHLCNMFRYLVDNPSRIINYSSILQKDFDDIMLLFKEIYTNQDLRACPQLIISFAYTLNIIIYELYDLGEKAVWLHITRAS